MRRRSWPCPTPRHARSSTVADEAIDDGEAPISDARPSSPAPDPALVEALDRLSKARGLFSADDVPLPPDDAPLPLDDAPLPPNGASLAPGEVPSKTSDWHQTAPAIPARLFS
jgi:hypothetical protein